MPTLAERQERATHANEKAAADAVIFFFTDLGFGEAQISKICNDLGRYQRSYLASVARYQGQLEATATKK